MRTSEHDRHLLDLHEVHGLSTSVISGIVHDNYGMLSPIASLFIQGLDQFPPKDAHDFGICVNLGKCGVQVPNTVYSNDEAYSWGHLLRSY